MRPHRRQPTRLPCPWDSPGKNTGVGCHFLLQCIKVKSESEVTQSWWTLSDPMDCSLPGSSVYGFSRQEYWSGVPLPSPNTYSQLKANLRQSLLICQTNRTLFDSHASSFSLWGWRLLASSSFLSQNCIISNGSEDACGNLRLTACNCLCLIALLYFPLGKKDRA